MELGPQHRNLGDKGNDSVHNNLQKTLQVKIQKENGKFFATYITGLISLIYKEFLEIENTKPKNHKRQLSKSFKKKKHRDIGKYLTLAHNKILFSTCRLGKNPRV